MGNSFERQKSFGWMINAIANNAGKKFDVELKKHGMSKALWPTMMCLWEKEGLTQRDIAELSKVENSTTTRTIDKLENMGLVERQADPQSRRSFRIYLTQEGHALKETLLPLPLMVNKELMSVLSEEEQKQLIPILQKLVASI